MRRRHFLQSAAAAALCATTHAASTTEVEATFGEPGATISPHLYGHFIEHLGGVIYDGIWVGETSSIAHIGGIRRQFVEDLKRIGAPNFRWPGGCFADGYHWRDGLGNRTARRRAYNYWEQSMPPGMHATENNHFGIHEFMRLCRLVGAEPYVAGNVGSGSPRELHEWVSYCNAPAGTESLANERASNGDAAPFNVKYWGIGNESWGCGGNMRPDEYARLYRLFITQFPAYTPPFFVATGPRGHSADMDLGWTKGFFEGLQGTRAPLPQGLGVHYYTDFRTTGTKAGVFTDAGWYTVFQKGLRTEEVITRHWEAMGALDAAHRTRFVIDEWGVWYPPGEEIAPGYILSQPITLRDALHTAVTFDIFNRHADKIAMANVAQTINCIHSLFLAQGDRCIRTPAYSVFDMYQPHKGARNVPVRFDAGEVEVPVLGGTARLPRVSASASLNGKRLFLTMTNLSLGDDIAVRVNTHATEARGMMLTHADKQATNTWARPNEVTPRGFRPEINGQNLRFTLPAKAVVAVEVTLA